MQVYLGTQEVAFGEDNSEVRKLFVLKTGDGKFIKDDGNITSYPAQARFFDGPWAKDNAQKFAEQHNLVLS